MSTEKMRIIDRRGLPSCVAPETFLLLLLLFHHFIVSFGHHLWVFQVSDTRTRSCHRTDRVYGSVARGDREKDNTIAPNCVLLLLPWPRNSRAAAVPISDHHHQRLKDIPTIRVEHRKETLFRSALMLQSPSSCFVIELIPKFTLETNFFRIILPGTSQFISDRLGVTVNTPSDDEDGEEGKEEDTLQVI